MKPEEQCPTCHHDAFTALCFKKRNRINQDSAGKFYKTLICPLWEPRRAAPAVEDEMCPTCGKPLNVTKDQIRKWQGLVADVRPEIIPDPTGTQPIDSVTEPHVVATLPPGTVAPRGVLESLGLLDPDALPDMPPSPKPKKRASGNKRNRKRFVSSDVPKGE